jgi:hypothetical protein
LIPNVCVCHPAAATLVNHRYIYSFVENGKGERELSFVYFLSISRAVSSFYLLPMGLWLVTVAVAVGVAVAVAVAAAAAAADDDDQESERLGRQSEREKRAWQ